jgi:hypothetical protein
LRSSLSRFGFLRSGVTSEFLNVDGNMPVERDKLIIFVIVGIRTEEHCLRREVGNGSRLHCLFGKDCRSLDISSSVAGVKQGKLGGASGGDG